jgi:hypothetical protein
MMSRARPSRSRAELGDGNAAAPSPLINAAIHPAPRPPAAAAAAAAAILVAGDGACTSIVEPDMTSTVTIPVSTRAWCLTEFEADCECECVLYTPISSAEVSGED